MTFDDVLKYFENNLEAKPTDLPEEISFLIRLGRTGELATSADFLARFFCLHLKKIQKPISKGPADYDFEFVDKASEFFDYVGDRCLYTYLQKEGIVNYQDSNTSLLLSELTLELKAEVTEKGKEFFKQLQQKIKEAVEKHKQQQEQKTQQQ